MKCSKYPCCFVYLSVEYLRKKWLQKGGGEPYHHLARWQILGGTRFWDAKFCNEKKIEIIQLLLSLEHCRPASLDIYSNDNN